MVPEKLKIDLKRPIIDSKNKLQKERTITDKADYEIKQLKKIKYVDPPPPIRVAFKGKFGVKIPGPKVTYDQDIKIIKKLLPKMWHFEEPQSLKLRR